MLAVTEPLVCSAGAFAPSRPTSGTQVPSSQEQDASDREQNFRRWFQGSAVVDRWGRPLRVFHATDALFDSFELTYDIGFHFGSEEAANRRIEQAEMIDDAHILPVYLCLRSPLRVDDLYTWGPRDVACELVRRGVISDEQAWEAELVDRSQVACWLAAAGHDGLCYANETEGGGLSFIALHAAQIKSALANSGAFATLDTRFCDRDILGGSVSIDETGPARRAMAFLERDEIGAHAAFKP